MRCLSTLMRLLFILFHRRSHITSELRHSRSYCSQLVMGKGEAVAAGEGEIGGAISAITVC